MTAPSETTGTPATAEPPRPRARVRVVASPGEAYAAQLSAFFAEAWGSTATAAEVAENLRAAARENLAEPGTCPPAFAVLEGERIVGYIGTIPVRIWDGAAERPAYWLKGLQVLAEYRNGPLGFAVVKEAAKHLPWSAAFVVAPNALRLFGALGYTDLGAVPNSVRVLRPGRVLRRLDPERLGLARLPAAARALLRVARAPVVSHVAGAVGDLASRAVAGAARLTTGRLTSGAGMPLPATPELDALWRDARAGIAASAVRDGAYLAQRYEARGDYAYATVRERGRLVGLAVVKRPRAGGADERLAGIGVATLSDLLVIPGRRDVALALLGAVEALGRRLGADALVCSTSDPALGRLLRRQLYLPIGGSMHVVMRDVSPDAARRPRDLAAWWFTRGDADSDGAL